MEKCIHCNIEVDYKLLKANNLVHCCSPTELVKIRLKEFRKIKSKQLKRQKLLSAMKTDENFHEDLNIALQVSQEIDLELWNCLQGKTAKIHVCYNSCELCGRCREKCSCVRGLK